MLISIQCFLVALLEILCCKAFFEAFADKRQGQALWKGNVLLLALAWCTCFVFSFTASQFLLQRFLQTGVIRVSEGFSPAVAYAVQFLDLGTLGNSSMVSIVLLFLQQMFYVGIVSLYMRFCMQTRFWKSAFFTIIFQVLLFITDLVSVGMYVYLFHQIYFFRDICHKSGSLIAVSGRCLLFFLVLLIWRIRGKPLSCEKKKEVPFFLCAAVAVAVIWESVQPGRMERLYFFSLFAFISLAIAALYLVEGLLKREGKVYKRAMFRIKAQSQAELYRTLSENYERQQRKVHEYKNQILCIESLLRKKMYQELEEYVRSISGGFGSDLDSIQTNHAIADAVINRAYQEMLEKDILFIPKISDLSQIWIADGDLVAILSNLLENAIEACEKCQGRTVIKMKFVIEDGSIILSVRNTYEGELRVENGEFQSTKEQEAWEHGIGLKNIVEVVEMYGGSYAIQTEGKEFYIAILIPGR